MYNTLLNFYLVYFHLADLNLNNFREEIVSVYRNDDSSYKYAFFTNTTYYIHLFLPDGTILYKLPFELESVNDDEDILEDIYNLMIVNFNIYLGNLNTLSYPTYVGIYIGFYPENCLDPKDLFNQREIYLINNNKMNNDLTLPLPLTKKW